MHCLVYVDPSPRGEWALALTAQLPAPFAPAVTLLATEEDLARDPGLLRRARERLERPGRSVAEAPRPGPAERALQEETRGAAYGLLVVPPAGRNAIQRMLVGSRIATVVRSVPASVLIARRPPPRVERVLAAVSGGALTDAVVRQSRAMAQALDAETAFLHVASEVVLPFRPRGPFDASATPTDPEESTRSVLRAHGLEEALLVREGLVVDEVLAEVENGAHDLLVIGAQAEEEATWGRDDLTERLVLGCPASVLVARDVRAP